MKSKAIQEETTEITIQDSDTGIIYTGDGWWRSGERNESSDGFSYVTQSQGDYFTFSFSGSAISYWSETSNDQGTIDIYIDDVFQSTIDTRSDVKENSHMLFCSAALSSDPVHTLKGVSNGGGWVLLDYLKIYNKTDFILKIRSSKKSYNKGIVIIDFNQSVDEKEATDVNNYQFDRGVTLNSIALNESKNQVTLNLTVPNGVDHYILKLGDIHNESFLVTTSGVLLDAYFEDLPPELVVNDNDPEIIYNDEWFYSSSRNGLSIYNDDSHACTAQDAWASMDFIGTGVSYFTETASSQGDVEIFIDNISQGLFSTYSDEQQKSQLIFKVTDLLFGSHNFRLEKKSGDWALIDALKIYNDGKISIINQINGPGKTFVISFDQALDIESATDINNFKIDNNGVITSVTINELQDTITIHTDKIERDVIYKIDIYNLYNQIKTISNNFTLSISLLTDDELLTLVQKTTFNFFWDEAHPNCGMAYNSLSRDKKDSVDAEVTLGGSGFGVMAVLVGIERNFITRQQGLDRINKIVDFLGGPAMRYKGVWPHMINGTTGETIPFSEGDNGGDLVASSYMVQGLLTARQYFNDADLTVKINNLWHAIDWNYCTNNSPSLYWHIDKDLQFTMGMKITGWNETMISYILAIASPTFPINPSLWESGWSQGSYSNKNKVYYGITLPVGPDMGGPMFWMHYSFLGFDPRNLRDTANDVNYYQQGVAQSQIQLAYSLDNPGNYNGYSDFCWGLTAGDDPDGYSAHSPTNDNGTINPTAAICDIAYTPDSAMDALRCFYDDKGSELWNDKLGFIDGFNLTRNWLDDKYLAIDQGPIIGMIENYRSELLWKHFMSCPEIQQALTAIGFVADDYPVVDKKLPLNTK